MPLFDRAGLDAAVDLVRTVMPATPTHAWPLLRERTGAEVYVKHENHTPTGAFKVRGGIVYMDGLKRRSPHVRGVVTATRGNHGQSIALAARRVGLSSTIYVPHGNSVEKNAAMRAFGANLVEHGQDFDEAKTEAMRAAADLGLEPVPSFHPDLARGVATYAFEMFAAAGDLDTVYVPIGLGSGICAVITVRDLLGLRTKVVGVVSAGAPCYARSVAAGHPVPTNAARTFADGMAVRTPDATALGVIAAGAERIVEVTDEEVAAAIRAYYEDTHNLAEGAGAAALAALMQERERMSGRKVGLVLSGGNIDRPVYLAVLDGRTPAG